MTKRIPAIASAVLLSLSLGLVAACEDSAEEEASDAAEEMGDAIEESAEAVEETAEEATDN